MKPLRFGITGTGGISHLHATCLKSLAAEGIAVLVAGADVDRSHADEFSKKWNVPVYDSTEELVAKADIDAVTVSAPSGLHCDLAMIAMKAGKHVLIEKPMDVLASKVEQAIGVSRQQKVTLGGIFQQRFPAGPQKVKRAIEQGAFGDIVFAHCETPWYRGQDYYDTGEWRGTWKLDCGVLSNQAVHMIDRLIWLAGDVEEVLSATCDTGSRRNIEAETNAVATIRLKNGALGTITASTLIYGSMPQRVMICGTAGSAAFVGDDLVSFQTEKPFDYDEPTNDAVDAGSSSAGASPLSLGEQSHRDNIRDFALAVIEGRQPSVGGQDGLRIVTLLNKIYEQANVGPYAR
jgi:UDP-N-acetyl-2-amino-2-deoxyglucuronate dehydrogenase